MTEILLDLEGHRLRRFRETDVDDLVRHANDPEVARWLRDRFPQPYTADDARSWIAMAREESQPWKFAIVDESGLIGGIGLEHGEDVYRYSSELGYWLGRAHWGRGIVSSAVRAICSYGFSELGRRRIYAHVFAPNTGSMRVLEKCGFSREGLLRQAAVKHGETHDEVVYSLLAEESGAAASEPR
jgi:RimJ/RimL family protein N-acetyltransferase